MAFINGETTKITVKSDKLFSEKLFDYCLEQPDQCDVTFLVGPQEEKVKALRIVLVVASPVFRKLFEEEWDNDTLYTNEEIYLPDFDPVAFKVFLKLLPSEQVTVEALEKLQLTPDQIFSLIELCTIYEMRAMQNVFEEMSKPFYHDVNNFTESTEFLDLSAHNLVTFLKSQDHDMPLDGVTIFNTVYEWTDYQCSFLQLDLNQENFRSLLGDALYEIPFSLMTEKEFTEIVCPKNILTLEEIDTILQIIKKGGNGNIIDIDSISTTAAYPELSTLRLLGDTEFVSHPFLTCDGNTLSIYFTVNKQIELFGLRFCGPADGDGDYDVTVEAKTFRNEIWTHCLEKPKHGRIFAKKNESFELIFDKPVICNPPNTSQNIECRTYLYYSLKGPNMQKPAKHKDKVGCIYSVKDQDGVEFCSNLCHRHIQELLFKKC